MRSPLVCLSLWLGGAASLAGCSEGVTCTNEFRFGVNATVSNARGGAPVVGATLLLTSGSYRETMMAVGPPGSYAGAGERPGTYTLTVTAAGFASPPPRAVAVSANECHVNGVTVPVELTPQ